MKRLTNLLRGNKKKKKENIDEIFANMEVSTVTRTLKLDINTVVLDPSNPLGVKGLSKEHMQILGAADISKEEVISKKDLVVKALNFFTRKSDDQVQTRTIKKAIQEHQPKLWYKNPNMKYKEINKLGKGGHASVSKYQDITSGSCVAIKKINILKSKVSVRQIKSEIAFLELSGHENLLTYYGTYQHEGELWIVLELMEGTIRALVGLDILWEEQEIAYVVREVLKGLAYLHSQNVIHRDIKSENILFNESGQVKLADFGFAVSLTARQDKRTSKLGTPLYVAPEVASGEEYNTKVDIWSLGVIAVELAEGIPPMLRTKLNHMKQVLELLSNNPAPELAEPEKWSKSFNEVVRHMLVKDPTVRSSAIELLTKTFFDKAFTANEFVKSFERLLKAKT